jgi:ferredoxin
MATTIVTEDCINCAACISECPNEAIAERDDTYVIDPERCTECVGFEQEEACKIVCPADCCVPDPDNLEPESVLLERARELHPEKQFPPIDALPPHLSRFRAQA